MVIVTVFIPKSNLVQFLKIYDLHSLRDQLSKLVSSRFISFDVIVKVSELSANDSIIVLVSNYISDQLKKRVPFRRVMRNAILKVKKIPLKGIKVQISGRLNGAEIARTEWIREGRIPLHTIDANIGYISSTVLVIFNEAIISFEFNFIINFNYFYKKKITYQIFFTTIYGILGIKIWICYSFYII